MKEIRIRRRFYSPYQQVALFAAQFGLVREYICTNTKQVYNQLPIYDNLDIPSGLSQRHIQYKSIHNSYHLKAKSQLLLPRRPSSGPRARSRSKEVPFKHIVIGILAPIMLEVHRHAKTKVNSNAVPSTVAQRGHVQHAVVDIPLGIHRYSTICARRVEVEEIETESWGSLLFHRVKRMVVGACRSAAWRRGVWRRIAVVVLMMLLGGHRILVLVVFHRGCSLYVRAGAIRRETRAGLLRIIGSNGVRLCHSATRAGLLGDRAIVIKYLAQVHVKPWHGSRLAPLGLSAWGYLLFILP